MTQGRKSFGITKKRAKDFIHFKKKKTTQKEKKEESIPRDIEIFETIPEERVLFRKKRK